jgi:hypothetical protein
MQCADDILIGIEKICGYLNVSPSVLNGLVDHGLPIIIFKSGIALTTKKLIEDWATQSWREQQLIVELKGSAQKVEQTCANASPADSTGSNGYM